MARTNRKPSGIKPKTTSRKSNAAGYAKRHSHKSSVLGLSDVYDHQDAKSKRSRDKVDTALDRDEELEFGVGGSDDDDGEQAQPRARLIGENGDDERIDSDDDEEIDSNAAFEESDEERFAGFFSSKKKTGAKSSQPAGKARSVRFADVDLNEDENDDASAASDEDDDDADEDMEDEGEGFIDVLDVLDGRAKPYLASDSDDGDDEEDEPPHSKAELGIHSEEEERDGNEGMEDGESEEDQDEDAGANEMLKEEDIAASDDDSEPGALEGLGTFIASLDPDGAKGEKRKTSDDPQGGDTRPRKRRFVVERTEAGPENEFGGRITGKLGLEDLLAPLAAQPSTLQALKKSTKALASSKTGPLAAPLPQRTQERLDREAAYEQTKDEVDKWKGTMKRIKEAEHLNFPLQATSAGKTSNLELNAKFKPTTELESSVDKLLKAAQMREEDLEKTEELKMNHLTVEEVAQRRMELRKMRELMFRAEVKAKRVSKIKSKTYRRIKKKERERLMAKLDAVEGDDDDDEQRMKMEVDRARERATLKHKNTGKWAKAMKARGGLDEDQRRDINEMLDRGERLRRKIQGRGSDDEDEESDTDDEQDVDAIKASAFEELARVDDADEGDSGEVQAKSVFNMKFMKDAQRREDQRARQVADDFVKELGVAPGSDDEGDVEGNADTAVAVERTGGRLVFRPGTSLLSRPLGSLQSDTSSITLRSTDFQVESPATTSKTSLPDTHPSSEPSNPWLAPQNGTTGAQKKNNQVVVSRTSAAAEKSKNKLQKRQQKGEDEKEKAREDATVEISTTDILTLDKSSKARGLRTTSTATAEDDPDYNSEQEEQERALEQKGKGRANGVKAFEQRDLVARAFAGDNVVQDFMEAKQREINADAPKEVDTTLPGWGAWGGRGTTKQKSKPHLIKKVAGIDPKTRADYNKTHVIISEKRDKKAAKYLVKDLPYPYTSKAQFERSTEMALGTEWNTRVGFQRGTLPKITKKMGTVISPLEKHL